MEQQAQWLEKAQELTPRLRRGKARPLNWVDVHEDSAAFQGWSARVVGSSAQAFEKPLNKGDSIILDFGRHVVGYVRLRLDMVDAVVDAPARLKLIFAEQLCELAEPLDPSPSWLCRSWGQDEIINVDWLPQEVSLPRRYAFRYLKIEAVAVSRKIRIGDVFCSTVTSASGRPPMPPVPKAPRILRDIWNVSAATLKDCMQTVFEDGPKRDRRLWLGDLRIQALANYHSFRNYDLVKRCLYLFAAMPLSNGMVPPAVYESPRPVHQDVQLPDYAALMAPVILEYATHSGDWALAKELWPVVVRQSQLLRGFINADGMFVDPGNIWLFVDWEANLHRTTPLQAICIFSFKKTLELAARLGTQSDVADLEALVERMSLAVRRTLIDPQSGLVISGPQRQVSYASAAWTVLAGVFSAEENAQLMRKLFACPDAVRPVTPYLHHHVIEAMLQCGLRQEAMDALVDYWGGMVNSGATTFWEVYVPGQDKASPYNDHHLNSSCHAWSCGPIHLIATYLAKK